MGTIQDVIEGTRNARDALQCSGLDTEFKTFRPIGLQRKGRDQRNKIGIAAALADAVERPLHVAHARIDGSKRNGNRLFRIVMSVDAKALAGNHSRHGSDDFGHLRWLRAAIRIAKNDPARACRIGGLCAGKRIFGIGLVSIEEMLAIDQRLPPRHARSSDRGSD